jgi:hypothetical protein
VARIQRDGRKPASRASTICEAAQISTSASHIVAMPCSCVPSTRMVMPPARKSIGAVRRDFASEKNGKAIKSWLSRHVARQRAEQVELFALQGLPWRAGHGDGHPRASDQRPSR